jgi:hypothetical protein
VYVRRCHLQAIDTTGCGDALATITAGFNPMGSPSTRPPTPSTPAARRRRARRGVAVISAATCNARTPPAGQMPSSPQPNSVDSTAVDPRTTRVRHQHPRHQRVRDRQRPLQQDPTQATADDQSRFRRRQRRGSRPPDRHAYVTSGQGHRHSRHAQTCPMTQRWLSTHNAVLQAGDRPHSDRATRLHRERLRWTEFHDCGDGQPRQAGLDRPTGPGQA